MTTRKGHHLRSTLRFTGASCFGVVTLVALLCACSSASTREKHAEHEETEHDHATRTAPSSTIEWSDAAPVAETDRFVFRSRGPLNLHDRVKRFGSGDHAGKACVDALAPDVQRGFYAAVDAFRAFAVDGGGRVELRVRYALAHRDRDLDESLGPVPAWYTQAVAAAEPAYRACFWNDDDSKNRVWIGDVVSLLKRAEHSMAARISAGLALSFDDERIDVDVVPWVSDEGANTVVFPHHILIGSEQPANGGMAALEIVFHEASHTIMSPRAEGAMAALRDAAEQLHVELPRDAWHVVLFYTAGHAAVMTVEQQWGERYVQYLYAEGLFESAWPVYRAPIERWWAAWLRQEITLDAAALGLIRDVTTGR